MKVYMVHSESGKYSDWTYDVRGIFSTVEKAVEYIESQAMTVYRHVGAKYGMTDTMRYDEWYVEKLPFTHKSVYFQQIDKVIDKRDIIPTSTDGRTFRYVMPDGKVNEASWWDWDNYYIDEYEVDCAN